MTGPRKAAPVKGGPSVSKKASTVSKAGTYALPKADKAPLSTQERVKEYNKRFADGGGRTLSTLRLKPDASGALSLLEKARGDSATTIISGLLLAAAKRIKE